MKKSFVAKLLVILILCMSFIPSYAETRNNNPLLREILIDGEEIKPEFGQFITDYVLAVDKAEIKIKAEPDDPNATVEIIGNTKLEVGINDIEIKVTAEDQKTTQSYYLHVTRGEVEKANANLKNIEVEGLTLNPAFNEKDTNYLVEYEGHIEKLNITATPENEKAKVEILDNDNFSSVLHIVTIKVTAEDGITTKEYKLTAKKAGENVENPSGLEEIENEIEQAEGKETKANNNIPIISAAIAVIVIVAAIIIINKKKK